MNAPDTCPTGACPLCGRPNQCAMEVERHTGERQPPCWCMQADVSADVLERIPLSARGRACICPACARPI